MLPHEIAPYADHHINKLNELEAAVNGGAILSMSMLEIVTILGDAQTALYRFKECMIDEVRQKENLQKQRYDCRTNHR